MMMMMKLQNLSSWPPRVQALDVVQHDQPLHDHQAAEAQAQAAAPAQAPIFAQLPAQTLQEQQPTLNQRRSCAWT